jgi:HD superfamily phosphodiesterase
MSYNETSKRSLSPLETLAIKTSEDLAKKMNTVAHHYEHADQVRRYAIEIAQDENLSPREIFLIELTALWHDIGLDYVEERSKHPEVSAQMFLETFPDIQVLTDEEKEKISFVLRYHDKYSEAQVKNANEDLLKMLRIVIDADTLELLGERGIKRAEETATDRNWPRFDPQNPLGETYNFTSKDFDERFKLKREGKIASGIEPTLVGQLNFQISCADLLFTKLAKKIGLQGVSLLKQEISEITASPV